MKIKSTFINVVLISLLFQAAALLCSAESTPVPTPSAHIEKEYYPNGSIHFEGTFKNGKLDGITREYSDTGNLLSETAWKYGHQTGLTKEFYPGGVIHLEAEFLDGNQDGITREYGPSGNLLSKTIWKQGEQDGEQLTYYPNGALASTFLMVKGQKEGAEINYYDMETINKSLQHWVEVLRQYGQNSLPDVEANQDDRLRRVRESLINWHLGEKHGIESRYDYGGNLSRKTSWVMGHKRGVDVEYDSSGNVRIERFFLKDDILSTLKEYTPGGSLAHKYDYLNGALALEQTYNTHNVMIFEKIISGNSSTQRYYDHNGQLRDDRHYLFDRIVTPRKVYYPNGRLYEQIEYATRNSAVPSINHYKMYDPAGKLIKEIRPTGWLFDKQYFFSLKDLLNVNPGDFVSHLKAQRTFQTFGVKLTDRIQTIPSQDLFIIQLSDDNKPIRGLVNFSDGETVLYDLDLFNWEGTPLDSTRINHEQPAAIRAQLIDSLNLARYKKSYDYTLRSTHSFSENRSTVDYFFNDQGLNIDVVFPNGTLTNILIRNDGTIGHWDDYQRNASGRVLSRRHRVTLNIDEPVAEDTAWIPNQGRYLYRQYVYAPPSRYCSVTSTDIVVHVTYESRYSYSSTTVSFNIQSGLIRSSSGKEYFPTSDFLISKHYVSGNSIEEQQSCTSVNNYLVEFNWLLDQVVHTKQQIDSQKNIFSYDALIAYLKQIKQAILQRY